MRPPPEQLPQKSWGERDSSQSSQTTLLSLVKKLSEPLYLGESLSLSAGQQATVKCLSSSQDWGYTLRKILAMVFDDTENDSNLLNCYVRYGHVHHLILLCVWRHVYVVSMVTAFYSIQMVCMHDMSIMHAEYVSYICNMKAPIILGMYVARVHHLCCTHGAHMQDICRI